MIQVKCEVPVFWKDGEKLDPSEGKHSPIVVQNDTTRANRVHICVGDSVYIVNGNCMIAAVKNALNAMQ